MEFVRDLDYGMEFDELMWGDSGSFFSTTCLIIKDMIK